MTFDGTEALAHGALAGGVSAVTSYPGTPGSLPAALLASKADELGFLFDWSLNERIALEKATGASMAGGRALVCVKSVGMNVLVDPLMSLNYTGVNGGLVILLGDDPGAYGSQNDQDSRLLVAFAELPLLEPQTPEQAFEMMRSGFALSEKLDLAVIIRITRSFSQAKSAGSLPPLDYVPSRKAPLRDPGIFVPNPNNAVALHAQLHDKLAAAAEILEASPFNLKAGSGQFAIITAGFAAQKLRDVIGAHLPHSVTLMNLGTLLPLPEGQLARLVAASEQVLVLEESEPFIENQLKAIAQTAGLRTPIFGKTSGHVPQVGELFRWQIQAALAQLLPDITAVQDFSAEQELQEHPHRKAPCAGCDYEQLMDGLQAGAVAAGLEPFLAVDPGCIVKVAERIHAKFAIGSAIALAEGYSLAQAGEKTLAIIGDSGFFHSNLSALCSAAVNTANVLVVVVENGGAQTTGGQASPNMGRTDQGALAPRLDILDLSRACGIPTGERIDLQAGTKALSQAVERGLRHTGPSMLIVTMVCEPAGPES
jgi:indolepyruvate ferredoxin oxidoreductase alpha subunit